MYYIKPNSKNKSPKFSKGGKIGSEVNLIKGHGYWDVTKYPYGGDFKRIKDVTKATLIEGTVKIGNEVRAKLEDGKEIVIQYSAFDLPTFEDKQELFHKNKHLWEIGYANGGALKEEDSERHFHKGDLVFCPDEGSRGLVGLVIEDSNGADEVDLLLRGYNGDTGKYSVNDIIPLEEKSEFLHRAEENSDIPAYTRIAEKLGFKLNTLYQELLYGEAEDYPFNDIDDGSGVDDGIEVEEQPFWVGGDITPPADQEFAEGGKIVQGYEVELEAVPNRDYNKGRHESSIKIKRKKVKVDSIEDAVRKCLDFISENDLGSGNWTGGAIYLNGELIARVAYNGKIIDPIGNTAYRTAHEFETAQKARNNFANGGLIKGSKMKISEGSGIDSGNIVTVVDRSNIKTDGSGVPTNVVGAYSRVDWKKYSPIQYDNGEFGYVSKNRLIPYSEGSKESFAKGGEINENDYYQVLANDRRGNVFCIDWTTSEAEATKMKSDLAIQFPKEEYWVEQGTHYILGKCKKCGSPEAQERSDAYGISTGMWCDYDYKNNYPYRKDRYDYEASGERLDDDYAKGGKLPVSADTELRPYNGRYLTLTPQKHNLKIELTEEGKEKAQEDGLTWENFYDYIEDIIVNSEYMYFSESPVGLTEAPVISEGYNYDDNGNLEAADDSRLYYYDYYMIKDFADELKEDGEVIFTLAEDSDSYAKGGKIKSETIGYIDNGILHVNLLEEDKDSDYEEQFEKWKDERKERLGFTDENKEYNLHTGDKVKILAGYNDDIEYTTKILGFDADGHAYLFWDSYWVNIDPSKRKLTKVD